MDWKEFLKPEISKLIIFILLLIVFGFPAFVTQCASYDFGTGNFPCGEPRFTFNNPMLSSYIVMLDAHNNYEYSPFLIAAYLFVLYFALSLIYSYTKSNKMQRIVYTTSFILLFIVIRIWISIL